MAIFFILSVFALPVCVAGEMMPMFGASFWPGGFKGHF
jgi:hypothetical protein